MPNKTVKQFWNKAKVIELHDHHILKSYLANAKALRRLSKQHSSYRIKYALLQRAHFLEGEYRRVHAKYKGINTLYVL